MTIELAETIDKKTKKFKCRCNKSGKLFERIKKKGPDGFEPKLSNTEAAFCDAEIAKFIIWLRNKGHGGDCWCKHIKEYTDVGI